MSNTGNDNSGKKKTLYVTDLDGTLMRTDKTLLISEFDWNHKKEAYNA